MFRWFRFFFNEIKHRGKSKNVLLSQHEFDCADCKNGLNFGKKYHVCCLWPVENCGFFKWEDDIKVNSFPATKELDALEKQALIIALQFRIRWFKENCKEMQAHNEKLKKEKEHLKKEVCQMCTKTEVCQMCGAHFEVFKK